MSAPISFLSGASCGRKPRRIRVAPRTRKTVHEIRADGIMARLREALGPSGARAVDELLENHGVDYVDAFSRSRREKPIRARAAVIAFAYDRLPDASLPDLGRIFAVHHTTILCALKRGTRYRIRAARREAVENVWDYYEAEA